MTIPHTTTWLANCRACDTTETVDPISPWEMETGPTCGQCGSAELTITQAGGGTTMTFFPAVMPPVKGWQCCHCGGGGLTSLGETCEHCGGLGTC